MRGVLKALRVARVGSAEHSSVLLEDRDLFTERRGLPFALQCLLCVQPSSTFVGLADARQVA